VKFLMQLGVISAFALYNSLVIASSSETDADWQEYQKTSKIREAEYRKFIQYELKLVGRSSLVIPLTKKNSGLDPNWSPPFFETDEGQRIADIVLSYQTPLGGWSKNIDMTEGERKPGGGFGQQAKTYVSTIDNGGTTLQIHLLAKAYLATKDKRYMQGLLKGLDYLYEAQYPNGGWPQNYPLDGGYHDHVTFNDDAMVDVLRVLKSVSELTYPYTNIPKSYVDKAKSAFEKSVECILETQQELGGRASIWAAQYHARHLTPAKARAYEPISLASAESSNILLFLMEINNPSSEVKRAIENGVHWFQSNKILGFTWAKGRFEKSESSKPLWARFYQIDSNTPIFGDRDGGIYYDVSEISEERRLGYGWYRSGPNKMLTRYEEWKKSHE